MVRAQLTITTGTDNFRKLVTTSDVFVDKTLFIKEIIDSGEEAILITRPRRWGKSLALDMLKTFFAIEVDKDGNKVLENPNRKLFKGLKIFDAVTSIKDLETNSHKEVKILDNYQGQFPIIHVSFKDVRCKDYISAENKLKSIIKDLYNKYKYLKVSDKLDEGQKLRFVKHHDGTFEESAEKKDELSSSLKFLTELLHTHHNQKVYVLVDEYDKPVNVFLEAGLIENVKARTEVAHLVEGMLGECGKDNGYIQKIILTGIFDTLKRSGISGFNNVRVFGLEHHKYASNFGFTENEVKGLIALLTDSREIQGKTVEEIQDWYNGYNVRLFGEELIKVYNPFAVMNYLSDSYDTSKGFIPGTPMSYWAESGMDDILTHLHKYKLPPNLLDKLKSLTEQSKTDLILPTFFHLLQATESASSVAGNMESIITYILFNGGYISRAESHFVIPNKEILEYFKIKVLEAWMMQKFGIEEAYSKALPKELSIALHDQEEFKKKVQELALNTMDSCTRTESDFHMLISGAIAIHATNKDAPMRYSVSSEKAVKGGRMDTIFYPIESTIAMRRGGSAAGSVHEPECRAVIIHEYKKLDRMADGELEKILYAGMLQMLEGGYISEPLSKRDAPGYCKWEKIKLRSVVFRRNEDPAGKWDINIKEKELDAAQAEVLKKFFANKLVRAELDLGNSRRNAEKARQNFITKLNTITGKRLEDPIELIDAVTADYDVMLGALRRSKLLAYISDAHKDNAERILTKVLQGFRTDVRAIQSGVKADFGADIPEDVIELLIDNVNKESLSKDTASISALSTVSSVVPASSARKSTAKRGRAVALGASSHAVKRPAPDTATVQDGVAKRSKIEVSSHATHVVTAMEVDAAGTGSFASNECQNCGGLLPGRPGAAAEKKCECPEERVVGFCTIHSYNPFYSHTQIVEVLKRAKEIGGRNLLSLLAEVAGTVEGGAQLVAEFDAHGIDATLHMIQDHVTARTYGIIPPEGSASSARKALVVYSDDRDGNVVSTKLIEQAKEPANPTLRLDPIDGSFSSFIKLVNQGSAAFGELLLKAQEMLNAILDSPESTKQTILTTMLLDIVDALHTAAPMPFFSGFGGDPDDDEGYGGSSGDNKPVGSDNGFGAMFGDSPDNTSFDATNTSIAGDFDDMNGNVW